MFKKLGLTLLVIAVIILLGYGLFNLFSVIMGDPGLPLIIKIGLLALIIGLIITFLAILKERIEDYKQGK